MAGLLALASAAIFGVADFAGGAAARRLNVFTVTLISNIVGAVLAGVLVVVFGGVASLGAIGWGAASGLFGVVGLVMLYAGLAVGPARLVSPLSGVLAALLPVIVGIAGGERPGTLAVIGLVLAPPAIWLVASGDHDQPGHEHAGRDHSGRDHSGRDHSGRDEAGGVDADGPVTAAVGSDGPGGRARSTGLALAIGAGLGFGLFFVCLARTPDDAGAVPLLAARLASTAVLVVSTLFVGLDKAVIERPSRAWLPATTGALDMTANGLYLWASRLGDLSVVAALTSLYPVSTVGLAVVVHRERLNRLQLLGLILAVASAALLS